MKTKNLFAGVALLALTAAVPAAAADVAAKKTAAYTALAAAPAAYTWAGLYIGGHAGYGAADFDGIFDVGETDPGDQAFGSALDVKGGLGGVQIGYLFQNGAWVYGGEVAASFMNWNDTTFDPNTGPGGDQIKATISNVVTVMAKLGFAANNMLFYGSIGAGRADAKWEACDECGDSPSAGSLKLKKWALAYGGGVTMDLGGRWSAGVEGTYIKFNDRKDASALNGDSDPGDFAELKNIWIVKGVLNYKLY
jgi:outer membrane immunogenic protein